MSFSVNTNAGALVALQYLSATQGQLNQTQSAINSGMKVATARDDGAIYAIAQNQRGAVAGYASVINSINNATSSVDVALSAGQSISDLLIQLKAKALAASDSSLDTASRQALNANFTALRDQITTIVKNAVFNGFNLVDGSTTQITALASADGTRRITTAAQDMKLSGTIVTMKSTSTISTQAKASALVATIQTSLTNVNAALAKLSSGAAKFSIQGTFVQKLSDTLTHGHRQPGGRQHGGGKRDAAVLAGQAAAGRAGSVDRQSGAADHPLPVPLNKKKNPKSKKPRLKGWWAKGGRRKLPALCTFVSPAGSGRQSGTACPPIRSGFAAAKRIHECSVISPRQHVTRPAHSEHVVFL